MNDTIAVVVPAWNASRFIADALHSVVAQTVTPNEIVVVDDGSTDATADLAAAVDPAITVLRREHTGIAAARNLGIASTTARWIALLDADDLWSATKLERQIGALSLDGSLEAIFCHMDEFWDESAGPLTGVRPPNRGVAARLSSSALLRRDLLERVGLFGSPPKGDWLEWMTRAQDAGAREFMVPEVLIRRRLHTANNSARFPDDGRQFLSIAREHLRVMRARDGTQ